MNDLELLRPATVFATVVKEGSFRAAAEKLNLSAPYVSQLVADLERRLGRQLLYRSTRKISLSADGERFLPTAQKIASALSEGLSEFRTGTADLTGTLRLSVPSVLAAPRFANILSAFQAQNQGLDLVVLLDDEAVDPIDRQIDLAIRIGDPGDDARPAKLLFKTSGVICASQDLANRINMPRDLETFRWIKTPAASTALRMTHRNGSDQTTLHPLNELVTNSGHLTRHMVAAGAGWALFPEFSVREAFLEGRIIRALPDWSLDEVGVYALYTARQSALSNAKAFVDFLESSLQGRN